MLCLSVLFITPGLPGPDAILLIQYAIYMLHAVFFTNNVGEQFHKHRQSVLEIKFDMNTEKFGQFAPKFSVFMSIFSL